MFKHYSVLLEEAVEGLDIKENGIYVDCTLGGAGHSLEILKRLKNGKLYAFDQDTVALENAKKDNEMLKSANSKKYEENKKKLSDLN